VIRRLTRETKPKHRFCVCETRDKKDVDALESRTEGWIVGLQLAEHLCPVFGTRKRRAADRVDRNPPTPMRSAAFNRHLIGT
jgi:hypothetical protein